MSRYRWMTLNQTVWYTILCKFGVPLVHRCIYRQVILFIRVLESNWSIEKSDVSSLNNLYFPYLPSFDASHASSSNFLFSVLKNSKYFYSLSSCHVCPKFPLREFEKILFICHLVEDFLLFVRSIHQLRWSTQVTMALNEELPQKLFRTFIDLSRRREFKNRLGVFIKRVWVEKIF